MAKPKKETKVVDGIKMERYAGDIVWHVVGKK